MQFLLKNVSADNDQMGNIVIGSPIITGLDTSTLHVGDYLNAPAGIPSGSTILTIDSATQITISNDATANGASDITFFSPVPCFGDEPILCVFAVSFGGGTVTVSSSPDNGKTWINLTKRATNTDATFTANANVTCYRVPQGHLIRAILSGSTGASGVYAQIGF